MRQEIACEAGKEEAGTEDIKRANSVNQVESLEMKARSTSSDSNSFLHQTVHQFTIFYVNS